MHISVILLITINEYTEANVKSGQNKPTDIVA